MSLFQLILLVVATSCQSIKSRSRKDFQALDLNAPLYFNPDPRADGSSHDRDGFKSLLNQTRTQSTGDNSSKLAVLELLTGNYDNSQTAAQKQLQQNRHDKVRKLVIAESALRQRKLALADYILNAHLAKNKDSVTENLRGILAFFQSEYAQAIKHFEYAIDRAPRQLSPKLNLAILALRVRRFQLAKEILDGLNNKFPNHPDVQIHAGIVQSILGSNDLADKSFKAILRNYPDSPLAHFNLAVLEKKQGRTQESRQLIKDFLKIARARKIPTDAAVQLEQSFIGH